MSFYSENHITTSNHSSICSFGKKFPFILSKNVSLILSFIARCLSLLSRTLAEGIFVRRIRGRSSSPVVVRFTWWTCIVVSFFLWASPNRCRRIWGYIFRASALSDGEFSVDITGSESSLSWSISASQFFELIRKNVRRSFLWSLFNLSPWIKESQPVGNYTRMERQIKKTNRSVV